jgi:DNA recombination protein RmuC
MFYTRGVVYFLAGLVLGGLLVGLWMRARLARLEAAQEFAGDAASRMTETFQSLADSSLRSNQTALLSQNHAAVEGAVKPLGDSLLRLESQVRELERAREKVFGSLDHQLQSLARETLTLSNALRSPQARGRWGEVTLRRVAELSGMVKNCDFSEQETRDAGDGGRIRPDMIVRLPGGRLLAVDAKVPLTAYLDAIGAIDETVRRAALQRHSAQVSEHVKQLSGKQYWAQFQPAPELVVLFLPGDHFFSAALEINPALIEDAMARKVVIATPVTLISILKGISYGWTQEQLAENAEEIRRVSKELYDRVQVVFEYYAETGRALEKTVEAYNRSVGSWDSRLTPALRRLNELGIGSQEPEVVEPVDIVTRRPRALGA